MVCQNLFALSGGLLIEVGETGLEPVTSSLSYRIGFHRPRATCCGLDYILTISGPLLVVSEASRKLR